MGYTNYYTSVKADKFPRAFIDDVTKIIKNSPCHLVGWNETDIEATPDVTETRIALNGLLSNGHESFVLVPSGEWAFCKTCEKPYDVVVKAILILAQKYGVVSEWRYDKADNEPFDIHYTDAEQLLTDVLELNRTPEPTEYYIVTRTVIRKDIRGHHDRYGMPRVLTEQPSLYKSFKTALADLKMSSSGYDNPKVIKNNECCFDVITKNRWFHYTLNAVELDNSESR